MRFSAQTLDELKNELERAFTAPDQPRPVYSCSTAEMPPAENYPNSVVLNTTLNVLAFSNGQTWIRADNGDAI